MIRRKPQITDLPNTNLKLVTDPVLVKKHNKAKLELKWQPGYTTIKLPTDWTPVVENQLTGKSTCCNVTDLKLKLPEKDWLLKAEDVGRAATFVNNPHNLPDIDLLLDGKDTEPNKKLEKVTTLGKVLSLHQNLICNCQFFFFLDDENFPCKVTFWIRVKSFLFVGHLCT